MAEEATVGVLQVVEGVALQDTLGAFQSIGGGTVVALECLLVAVLAVGVSTGHTDAGVDEGGVILSVVCELERSGAAGITV